MYHEGWGNCITLLQLFTALNEMSLPLRIRQSKLLVPAHRGTTPLQAHFVQIAALTVRKQQGAAQASGSSDDFCPRTQLPVAQSLILYSSVRVSTSIILQNVISQSTRNVKKGLWLTDLRPQLLGHCKIWISEEGLMGALGKGRWNYLKAGFAYQAHLGLPRSRVYGSELEEELIKTMAVLEIVFQ